MKIPKLIHYCWFGKNEKPTVLRENISKWKKIMPEYQFIEWNEDNFDLNSNQFVKEAYENKKYAFVTDYVRLYALAKFGGIYLDTDVEVVKKLDNFLNFQAFTGTEGKDYCVTGTMGSIPNHPWIERLLEYYKDISFISKEGEFNNITNTTIITKITVEEFGWERKDSYQILEHDLHIFPFVVFCAKDLDTGKIMNNEKTYTIHHFSGSWHSDLEKRSMERNRKIKNILIKTIGLKNTKTLLSFFRKTK